jgi:histidine triad (HIT) family protein
MSTIFEKIIARELPAEIVFENERIIAIKDLYPAARVHLLVITKKVIANFQEMAEEDYPLLAEIAMVAQRLACEFDVEESYRLLTNCGSPAGQTIFHLHFHLIGGQTLGPMA